MNYNKILKKLTCFNDIYSITKSLTEKQKGDLFEWFTYYTFKYDPRLNIGLEEIWMYSEIPNHILEILHLPSKDKGIDLLIKKNNQYYAIQCKFRENITKTISWQELSTFYGLSFGMTDSIVGGYLVTNTLYFCKEVLNSNKVITINGQFFQDYFQPIITNKIIYKGKSKYAHQQICIDLTNQHFENNDRGFIEMACGAGKTLSAYWIAENYNKIVVFVPSLQLLSQIFTSWVIESHANNKKFDYLLIGTNANVDDKIKSFNPSGLNLTTDINTINQFLQKDKIIVICTYQSSNLLSMCQREIYDTCNIPFDLGVFDEAHKTVQSKDTLFTSMLSDDNMYIKKRLFMTATPKNYKKYKEDEEDNIISMDNEKIYGKCIYSYNIGSAIQR